MSPREIESLVVEALLTLRPDENIGMRQLRSMIGCGTKDLSVTLGRMRNQGKLAWDVIALRPSMRPGGEPAQVASVAEEVKAEAQSSGIRRRSARRLGTLKRPSDPTLSARAVVEALQAEIASDPHSLMQAVARAHADSWSRIVALSRMLDERPAQTLYRALEAGIDVLEADVIEDQARQEQAA